MDDIHVRERKCPRISDRLRAKLSQADHSPDLPHDAKAGISIARPARGVLDQQGIVQQLALGERDCEFGRPDGRAGILHAACGCCSRIAVNCLSDRPISAVFTGGLTYQPNLDALHAYVEKVLPAFAQLRIEPPQLSVIGLCPEFLKAGLAHPTIRFLGYVPDINEELRRYQVFLAPIVSGSGIKTKVLERWLADCR